MYTFTLHYITHPHYMTVCILEQDLYSCFASQHHFLRLGHCNARLWETNLLLPSFEVHCHILTFDFGLTLKHVMFKNFKCYRSSQRCYGHNRPISKAPWDGLGLASSTREQPSRLRGKHHTLLPEFYDDLEDFTPKYRPQDLRGNSYL